jgi:hypothetical protein
MHRFLLHLVAGACLTVLLGGVGGNGLVSAQAARVIENFEQYSAGVVPDHWFRVNSKTDIKTAKEELEPGERFEVVSEDGNRFVRLVTEDEYVRFSQRNGKEFDWNLKDHPRLQWRWRALTLPEGASERDQNDTGGAVYVTFGTDWLGRPKSIKYTYSSSLPVGTVVSFGNLKVIVVESAKEPGQGTWKTETRHVRNDYRQVFGDDPPDRPVSITISGDSNTTNTASKVDFDDIRILPSHRAK